jgi:hypothetical protein
VRDIAGQIWPRIFPPYQRDYFPTFTQSGYNNYMTQRQIQILKCAFKEASIFSFFYLLVFSLFEADFKNLLKHASLFFLGFFITICFLESTTK